MPCVTVLMLFEYSKTKNGTLGLEANTRGLFIFADLSKSQSSRELYEEISAGLITQMSWAFTVESDTVEQQDKKTYIRRIERIKKVFDVSAVSIPANADTEINARSFEAKQQELLRTRARLLKLKIFMEV